MDNPEDLTERSCLTNIYENNGGVHWKHNSHWNTSAHIDKWRKVKCLRGNVVRLDLSDNFLVGEMPILSGLRNILELNLSSNELNGSISWDIFASVSIIELIDLSHNSFVGPIDWMVLFTNAVRLRVLNLSNNNFNGDLP